MTGIVIQCMKDDVSDLKAGVMQKVTYGSALAEGKGRSLPFKVELG